VGHPEWFEGDEPRPERVKNAARKLIEFFPTQPSAYWLERIEAADVPCGPINDFDTIWSDPQFVANQTLFEYEHPRAGRVRAVRSPARFSRTRPELKHHAPALGQQTDEVLAEFGFDSAEIAALRERKVIN
jgi:crotonobetainyl-CoA:carnitine CoA-transferase CaiB-like acyl-CoA transferase